MAHIPHTWNNGDVVTASLLNAIESDLANTAAAVANVDNTADADKPVSAAQADADTAVQAYAIQRSHHTGTQTADTLTDGTTNKTFLATERTKLAGIATGATANRSDTATDTLLAAKADLIGGLIPSAQIPSIALSNAVTVASQTAMLALTTSQVQPGDVAVRTDGAGTFILTAPDPTVLGNWTRLNAPTDAVTTVNGQAGTVVLGKTDVGLSNVDNTADTNKPISGAQATALALKAPLASPTFTGTVSGITAAMVGADPAGAATSAVAAQAATNAGLYIPQTQLGAAGGVATLDNTGVLSASQLPASSQSLFLASTGVPSSTVGLNGDTALDISPLSAAPAALYSKTGGAWAPAGVQLAQTVAYQFFTTNGTWTMPLGAKMLRVVLYGAGGGGGSGARNAATSVPTGGAGGGGGAMTDVSLPASAVTATVAITCGTAGTGGGAATVNGTSGTAGTGGGISRFGSYLKANGGGGGGGGGAGVAATAGAGGSSMFFGGAAQASSATGAAGGGGATSTGGAPGGGAGGGVTSAGVASAGGAGGNATSVGATNAAAGTAEGGTGGNGTVLFNGSPGGSGGGGGSAVATAGGSGGAGIFGGGGGGGGAAVNGNNSGTGGAGGGGCVLVITYF